MKDITVKAKVEELNTVNECMNAFLDELSCSPKLGFQLEMVMEELFVNVASYAYGDETPEEKALVWITFDFDRDTETLMIQIKDAGVAFDPLAKKDVDVDEKVNDDSIGGLGIYLVKQMMDSITYDRKDGNNILTLTKKIAE